MQSSPKDSSAGLGKRARAGLCWDLGGSFSRQLSTLSVSVILARLLEPAQFGVIGMALVFVSISEVFIDVGLTTGLVQRQNVTQRMYSTAFFLNLFIGLLIAAGIYFAAPLIGGFYGNHIVTDVVRWLALVLPISAMGKVHQAQLTKKLRFKALVLRDIFATLSGGIVGVCMAFYGFGVYSLVGQQLTFTSVGMVALWVGTGWKPSAVFSFSEIRSLMSFSVFVFFDHILRQIFQKIDTLFIGKVFSPAILGYYSRAESLNAQVTSYTSGSLQKILFPALSSVQDDKLRFESIYFRVFKLASTISSTLAGILFFLGDQIILILLGDKWVPSIVLFRILLFRSLFAPIISLIGTALLSRGFSRIKFKFGIIQRAIMLTPMIVGYFYGINAFAMTLVCTFFLSFCLYAALIQHLLHFSFLVQVAEFFRPLIPMFIIMTLYSFIPICISSYLVVIVFILSQFAFLKLTSNEGAEILGDESRALFMKLRLKLNSLAKKMRVRFFQNN